MSDKLPYSLSYMRAEMIKALHLIGGRISTAQIKDYFIAKGNDELTEKVSSNIHPLAHEKKYVYTQAAGKKKLYYLSPLGTELAKSLIDNPGEVVITSGHPGGRTKKPKKEEQQEIQFEQLNVSKNAANLADGLTAVIQENQHYRNLLLQVHKTIGQALGIEPPSFTEE